MLLEKINLVRGEFLQFRFKSLLQRNISRDVRPFVIQDQNTLWDEPPGLRANLGDTAQRTESHEDQHHQPGLAGQSDRSRNGSQCLQREKSEARINRRLSIILR